MLKPNGLMVTMSWKPYFILLEWVDALEIVTGEGNGALNFFVKGAELGDSTQNTCYKAYHLLKQDFELPAVDCYLQKAIPQGAGLGGGSSDGAFVLKMLNEQFALNIKEEKLAAYAAQLGSDCPFFIYNKPMLATGRGELLQPINISLKDYYIVIVMPPVAVSTKEAYSLIKPKTPDVQLDAVIMLPVNQWKHALVNDFEEVVFKKHPLIAEVKEQLYINGAIYASMSGSGAAVYGIFKNQPTVDFAGLCCLAGEIVVVS